MPAVRVLLSESSRIKDPVNVGLQGAQGDVGVLGIRRGGRYSQRGVSWTCRQGVVGLLPECMKMKKSPIIFGLQGCAVVAIVCYVA